MELNWTYENAVQEIIHLLGRGFGIVGQVRNGIFRAYVTQYNQIPVFGGRITCCHKCAFNSAYRWMYEELKEAGKMPEKDSDNFDMRIPCENIYCSYTVV